MHRGPIDTFTCSRFVHHSTSLPSTSNKPQVKLCMHELGNQRISRLCSAKHQGYSFQLLLLLLAAYVPTTSITTPRPCEPRVHCLNNACVHVEQTYIAATDLVVLELNRSSAEAPGTRLNRLDGAVFEYPGPSHRTRLKTIDSAGPPGVLPVAVGSALSRRRRIRRFGKAADRSPPARPARSRATARRNLRNEEPKDA